MDKVEFFSLKILSQKNLECRMEIIEKFVNKLISLIELDCQCTTAKGVGLIANVMLNATVHARLKGT